MRAALSHIPAAEQLAVWVALQVAAPAVLWKNDPLRRQRVTKVAICLATLCSVALGLRAQLAVF